MADRSTKERKLVALMVNDMESSLGKEGISMAEEEAHALSDEDLDRTLASRLGLDYPTDEAALDDAIVHVQERETPPGTTPGDITPAPDMSHEPGPGEHGGR